MAEVLRDIGHREQIANQVMTEKELSLILTARSRIQHKQKENHMNRVSAILMALLLSSCASTSKMEVGKAELGYSMENPITFPGVASESQGVALEYKWVRDNLPGCKVKTQSLIHQGKKSFDSLELACASGQVKVIYFDITSFFGKY